MGTRTRPLNHLARAARTKREFYMIKVYFLQGNSPEIEWYYADKEYRHDVFVEKDNLFYDVHFFTQSSLTYEMTRSGFFSLPGLIVLDDISKESIIRAIVELSKFHFFEKLKGLPYLDQSESFIYLWYKNLSLFSIDSMNIVEISNI